MRAVVLGATLLAVVCIGMKPHVARGATVFLGVGNDGFFSDVSGLWNTLQEQPGWEDSQGRLCSDQTGVEILEGLSWLRQAGPGDVAVWYYSGHGGSFRYDQDLDEPTASTGNRYDETIGLLNDSRPATDDQIMAALAEIDQSVPIVAILDTCHAGGFVGGDDDLSALGNVVAMLSSQENQNSYGGEQYSLFTAGLIAGLEAGLPADLDRDGILYSDEWFNYAAARIAPDCSQQPMYWAGSELARVAIVVPEPATVGLLVFGSLLLCRRFGTGENSHDCIVRRRERAMTNP